MLCVCPWHNTQIESLQSDTSLNFDHRRRARDTPATTLPPLLGANIRAQVSTLHASLWFCQQPVSKMRDEIQNQVSQACLWKCERKVPRGKRRPPRSREPRQASTCLIRMTRHFPWQPILRHCFRTRILDTDWLELVVHFHMVLDLPTFLLTGTYI